MAEALSEPIAPDHTVPPEQVAVSSSEFTQVKPTGAIQLGPSTVRVIVLGRDGVTNIASEPGGLAVTFTARNQPERSILIPFAQIAYATKGPAPMGAAY